MAEPLDDPIVPENPETRRDWEIVQHDPQSSTTDRLRIVGGWLYRTRMVGAQGVALVYVPGRLTE